MKLSVSENSNILRKQLLKWGGRILTVLVSIGIIYYFLRDINFEQLREQTKQANIWLALFGAAFPLLIFWITDAAFTVKSFEWFHKPVSFLDYFIIKGALYIITMVNVTFATGGVFLYFKQKTGAPIIFQMGLLAWRITVAVTGLLVLLVVMTLLFLLFDPGSFQNDNFKWILPAALLCIAILAEVFLYTFYGKGMFLKKLPDNIKDKWLSPFDKSELSHWLFGWGYSVPPIILSMVGQYLVARAFGMEIPFFYFMICVPLTSCIASLPVAFAQFGTTTAAWSIFYLGTYCTMEQIVAVTLFIPTVKLCFRAGVGIIFMPFAIRELESAKNNKPE